MAEYNRAKEKICACCGKIKKLSNFYPDYRRKDEYLPYCRLCLTQMYREAVQGCGDIWGGLCSVATQMGMPMLAEPFAIVRQQYNERSSAGKKPDVVDMYYKTMRDLNILYKGNWESEIQLSDFVDCATKPEIKEDAITDYESLVRTWGKFIRDNGELDTSAYDFLEDTFNMYTGALLNMDASMTMRYRDLCKAELMKRRADEGGDVGEIAKAQDNLKKMLAMLKLDDFQSAERSEMEKHIERICWTIENTKPAECEDLEKYRDFSGFEKHWATIKRCVLNAVARTKEYPELPKDMEV